MQQQGVSHKALIVGIVSSMFLWGLSWPSNKVLSHYCSAVNFTVYRYIIVVVTMVGILLVARTGFRVKKAGIPFILASGILLAAYSFLFYNGLKNGSAGAGGVLVTTMNPLMAYALNMLLKRKLPSGNELAGLTLGVIAGCVLLQLWDNTSALMDSGNLFFLAAAFTWSVMSKFTAKGAMYSSSMGFSTWQYLVTLLCLLPFTNFAELQQAIHITDSLFWLNLFFGSAIVTSGATTMYFYTTTRLGAEKASSFIFLVPLCAALSSWWLLGEHIKLHTAIGGALGMGAVYIMNKRRPAEKLAADK